MICFVLCLTKSFNFLIRQLSTCKLHVDLLKICNLKGLSHGILSYLEETRETLRFEGSVFRTSQYACNTDWSVDISQGEIKYKEPTNSTTLHSDIRDVEFITFGIVLIVWEVLPTFMFVWFFRVRRPNVGDMVSKSE